MSFRSKLLCVSAIPVVALTAIAGLVAADLVTGPQLTIIACVAALVSATAGVILARRVGQPLHQLTRAAHALASEQLPSLVSAIAKPSDDDHRYLAATIKPIEVDGDDEIGQLARAFNSVQTVAVDVAAEQSQLLRKGISDLFMHLARRNQALIERQIELFDELEATERDADRLAQLYRLDHLATRMRRNAESLLVLAGMEPARRRSEPVAVVDVLRAAIGEVEDYARIDLGAMDDIRVQGTAALDLAHLLAELLENATRSSPPTTRVVVSGSLSRGAYMLTVADDGIGMGTEALEDANALLASPPPVGLALGRALGFTVVSRLAARHGASVRLAPRASGGVDAIVHLPNSMIVLDAAPTAPAPAAPPVPLDDPADEPVVDPADEPVLDGADDDVDMDALLWKAWDEGTPATPATLAEALPQGAAFERGLADLVRGDEALGPPALVEPPVVQGDDEAARTSAGLVRRVPKAPALPAPASTPAVAATSRTAEEVRAMLARYRKGQDDGRADAHQEVLTTTGEDA